MKFVYCLVVLLVVAVNAAEEKEIEETAAEASQPQAVKLAPKPLPKTSRPIQATYAPLKAQPKPILVTLPPQVLKPKATLLPYKPKPVTPSIKPLVKVPVKTDGEDDGAYKAWKP